MDIPAPFDLQESPVHLGLGATVVREPAFTGAQWYEQYIARHMQDGAEGRLVSLHRFDGPWTSWEMHPSGGELVVCLEGRITLHQEIDGRVNTAVLEPGQAIINPPGVWHTADVAQACLALFVTAGLGTEQRPR